MPGRSGPLRTTDRSVLIGFAAVLAGFVAVTGPAAPTGHAPTDTVLVGIGVALLVVIGSRAPWWVAGVAAGIALATALDPVLMAVAVLGLAAALWAGTSRRAVPWILAGSLGVTFNVLLRSHLDGPTGTSAAVGMGVACFVFVAGTWFLPTRARWLSWGAVVVLVVGAGVAVAGVGYAVAQSRHELGSGMSTAELGVAALEEGDFEAAADWFEQARSALDAANDNLGQPWARAAAVVPVAAYYQRAVHDMSREGADALRTVSEALDEIDLHALRPEDGHFDLTALASLDAPLTRVRDALVELKATADDARSVWLVNRATNQLDDFSGSVDVHLPSIEDALTAIRMAPAMLGADESRTYLLVFTTPSESRGLGGFVGSYAELHLANGQLTLGEFERAQDLDAQLAAAGAHVRDHDEFLHQYGRFGYDADGSGAGLVGDSAVRNLALTPDFPTVAAIASDLYLQATGTQVDGVIAMDPVVVSQLLRYTGPVTIPSLGREISADDALPFLLRDQYGLDVPDDARSDGLAEAAEQAFTGLIAGGLPDPIALARDMGPSTSDRRLMVWSAHEAEQDLFERVDIAGAIPPLDGADGWAFTVANAGGSKIDTFLTRRAGYTATTDPDTGARSATIGIELDNAAPTEGFPRYVIGNRSGESDGTSSLWLSIYSPLGLDRLRVDGVETGFEVGSEQGWNVYRVLVNIPSMTTVTIEASLSGTVADPTAEIVTWEQPMESDVEPL